MQAKIIQPNQASLDLVSEALLRGETVAVPTETVYGLAANALDARAAAAIFTVKERPAFDPLIVHISRAWANLNTLDQKSLINVKAMTSEAQNTFKRLAEKFWPGPLTMILPRGESIPLLVTSGLEGVALRCPAHLVFQNILSHVDLPLAAPSANRFGRISPTTAEAVKAELGERINYIVDGGACTYGVESTVVAINDDGSISLLRPGGLALEQLETEVPLIKPGSTAQQKASPGHSLQHYAPRKPLFRLEEGGLPLAKAINHLKAEGYERLTVIGWNSIDSDQIKSFLNTTWLNCGTDSADGIAAAHDLFSSLRAADAAATDAILVLPIPAKHHLWLAIDDRLKRAKVDWPK